MSTGAASVVQRVAGAPDPWLAAFKLLVDLSLDQIEDEVEIARELRDQPELTAPANAVVDAAFSVLAARIRNIIVVATQTGSSSLKDQIS